MHTRKSNVQTNHLPICDFNLDRKSYIIYVHVQDKIKIMFNLLSLTKMTEEELHNTTVLHLYGEEYFSNFLLATNQAIHYIKHNLILYFQFIKFL